MGGSEYVGSKSQTNTLKLLSAENEEKQYKDNIHKDVLLCFMLQENRLLVQAAFYHTLLILPTKRKG